MMLAFVTLALLAVDPALLPGADPKPPVVAPWDFEAQLQTSPTIKKMQTQIDAIAKHNAAAQSGTPCPCGPDCPCCAACPGKQSSTTSTGVKATVVRKADGSCVCQVCDANGCREVPCDCSQLGFQPSGFASPSMFASPSAGCSQVASYSYASPVAAPVVYYSSGGGAGDCASGSCSSSFGAGGSCASGNCGGSASGSSGKRGLFGRRR